jgi:hypothetical protein
MGWLKSSHRHTMQACAAEFMNRPYAISPEMELLLLCIQPQRSEKTADRIRTVALGQIDWNVLLELASWHTVAPLLYWSTATLGWSCPAEITGNLRSAFKANSLRNLFLTGELVKILGQFEESGIPVITYKGPVLANYYGNAGAREFQDLDLLIPKKDLAAVDRMLRAAGFQPSEQRLEFARAFDFEVTYENQDQSICIDLHWSLMPRYFEKPGEANGVLDRAVIAHLAGRQVRTLQSQDSVLLLCAHGTKHIWESLGWICDVARVVDAHAGLDWDRLFQKAAELRMVRALSLGLLLAIELLHLQIPERFRSMVTADPNARRLSTSVYEQLFEDRSSYWSGKASSRFLMSSRDSTADAIRCGAERIFLPTKAEWRSVRLPVGLFPLYYPLRLLRLLGKHAGRHAED